MVILQKRHLIKASMLPIMKRKASWSNQLTGSLIFSFLLSVFGPAYSSELESIPIILTTTQDPKEQLRDQMQDYRNREAAWAIELQRAKEAAAKRAADTRAWQLERELKVWPQYGLIRVYWPGWSYDKKSRSWLTLTRPAEKPEFRNSTLEHSQAALSSSIPLEPLRPDPAPLSTEYSLRPGGTLAPQLPAGGVTSLAPLRPSNASLASPPPRRFDDSLDNLVLQGVMTPLERSQIRQGAALVPIDVWQACRTAFSEQECRAAFAVRWDRRKNGSIPKKDTFSFIPPSPSGIAVDCTSLMLNIKPYDRPYSGWLRPVKYGAEERLIVDFCASQISKNRP